MICAQEFSVFDDLDTLQGFYGGDLDGVIPLPEMSRSEKQPQYEYFGMDMPNAVNYSDSDGLEFISHNYKALVSDQHALTAVPSDTDFDFLDDHTFGHHYQFTGSRVSSVDESSHFSVGSIKDEQNNSLTQPSNMTQAIARKRKASDSPSTEDVHPVKKAMIAHVQVQDPNGDLYDLDGEPSPYSSLVPTPAAGPVPHHSNSCRGSPRVLGHHHSTSNASQVSLAAPSPCSPAVSPSFTTANTEQSPCAPMTPAPRSASTASPFGGSNPKLVRTSTIPQQLSPSLSVTPNSQGPMSSFNPYAMYPPNTKARLELMGDLDDVALHWTDEELEARRKLIVFTRSQNGSVIEAKFKVVPQQEWNRADSTVNCIWWKEKKEAYVTSVDTIALLEQLVAVRFTVEEKNRIRRNLEGFRPLTVSKGKSDSEDFFKTIMGFPAPKPRNIEKDVKVFPWKILSHALKKIISKYSASYSSTASALPTAPASFFTPLEINADYHYPHSPGHEYPHSAPPTSAPDFEALLVPSRMPPPGHQLPDLHVRVPAAPTYAVSPGYPCGPVPFPPGRFAYPAPVMTAPTARMVQPWGYQGYAPPSHSPMTAASAPPTAFPPVMMDSAEYGYAPAWPNMQR